MKKVEEINKIENPMKTSTVNIDTSVLDSKLVAVVKGIDGVVDDFADIEFTNLICKPKNKK